MINAARATRLRARRGPDRPSCHHRGVVLRPLSGSSPQVVAHRGSSEAAAEHTFAAYELALAEGADAVECDVRLTRDGVLVCVHDRRVNRTSTGRGVVSSLELAELAELDFSSWHPASRGGGIEVEEPDRDRAGVLTLERLLEVVASAGRRVQVAIETKHPSRFAGLVELRLVELLSRLGLAVPATDGWSPVRVMSFASTSLRRIHALAPEVPTVLLLRGVPLRLRDGTLPQRVRIAGPSLRGLRAVPQYVARAHERGHEVHVWTVNRPEDVEFVVELGVDAVITDRPGAVLRQLGRG